MMNRQEKKIAIYVRESTKDQFENGYNIDTQIEKTNKYIDLYGLVGTIDLYVEGGKSAKTNNRPKLNELLIKIKQGYYTDLVVYKLDRLVRRNNCWQEVKQILDDNKVIINSVSEKIDTSTAMGRFMVNIIVSSAELEQDTISERTNDGLLMGAQQGNYIIGGKAPFGYERCIDKDNKKSLRQLKEEVEILYEIRNYLRNGYSPDSIKLFIKNDFDIDFCTNAIVNIIHNKIYKGVMEFKGKEYKLNIVPVFNNDEWDEMQSILNTRIKTSKYDYLFTGKVFTSNGKQATRKSTIKSDEVVLYYFDTEKKKRINEKDVVEQVVSYLQSSKTIYKKERNIKYDTELKRMNNKMFQLNNMLILNKIKKEIYDKEIELLNTEKKNINKLYYEYVQNIKGYFNNLSYKEKSLLIEKYVDRIEIDFSKKEVLCIC